MEDLLVQRWSNPQASRNHGVKRCFHRCDESHLQFSGHCFRDRYLSEKLVQEF
jgi:hypothetical protein